MHACVLYTDRASHYFATPKAGEKVAKDRLTQVGRARGQLGIEHIPASSPEARGRSERAFGTLQDRLPKPPEHNARFAPEHDQVQSRAA